MAKKAANQKTNRLFEEVLVPAKEGSGKLFEASYETDQAKPVECLGMLFPNDEARRAHFTEILRQKLNDPEFRKIEGFPIGEDEDILALSDPPYYTACPNPFFTEVISWHRSISTTLEKSYSREPFASDVSAGKSDPAYNVHAYPTKVPPDAISPLLAHFTDLKSVVVDPFAGTGMTGVSAHRLGGDRLIVLNDLSPLAAHISNAMTLSASPSHFTSAASSILRAVSEECGWMFRSKFGTNEREVRYFVWSDIYVCESCGLPIRIFDIESSESQGGLKTKVPCPKCKSLISKATMNPFHETYFDHILDKQVNRIKSTPVLKVTVNGNRSTKIPVTKQDIDTITELNSRIIPYRIPTAKMLFRDGCWGDQWRSSYHEGITHSHQFYTYRIYGS